MMTTTSRTTRLRAAAAVVLLFCTLFTLVLPAAAVSYPKQDKMIADEAGVLSESTIRTLRKTNESLITDVKACLAVCTVETTGDVPIQDYARDLFKRWKLGDGVLLLIATADNNYYLLQSVSVNKIITNEVLAQVRDEYFEEDFSAGNIDRAVFKTITRLSTLLVTGLKDTASAEEAAPESGKPAPDGEKKTTAGSVIVGFFKTVLWIVLIAVVLLAAFFVAAMFNDDCAALFRKYILRRGRRSSRTPDPYYDERLYGRPSGHPQPNGQRSGHPRPNGQHPHPNGQRPAPRPASSPNGQRPYSNRQLPPGHPNSTNRPAYPNSGPNRPNPPHRPRPEQDAGDETRTFSLPPHTDSRR